MNITGFYKIKCKGLYFYMPKDLQKQKAFAIPLFLLII